MSNTQSGFTYNEESETRAKAILEQYPPDRQASAVIPLLELAQRQNGWLSKDAMDYVADYLDIAPMDVYEVVSFYSMFRIRPVGKYHIEMCSNISCSLTGSDMVLRACRDVLGIGLGEISDDNLFSLDEVECLGACANAPVMKINDDYYEDLTYDSTHAVLQQLMSGKVPKPGSQIGRKSSEPAGRTPKDAMKGGSDA